MGDNLEGPCHQISRSKLFEVWSSSNWSERNEHMLHYVLHQLGLENAAKDITRPIRQKICRISAVLLAKWKSAGGKIDRFMANNRDWLELSEVFEGLVEVESEEAEQQSTTLKPGRPPKTFEDCSTTAKRARVQHLVESDTAEELNYAAQIALNASGSRTTAKAIKVVSESPEGAKKIIAATEAIEKQQTLSGEEALAFYVDNELTHHTYKNIRKKTLSKGHILYPSLYMLRKVKGHSVLSANIYMIDDISARVNVQELLNLTIERLLIVLRPVIKDKCSDGTALTFVGKWGADGSSGQSLYKQKFSDSSNTDEFMFMVSYVPIKLHVTGDPNKVIWQNPNCSSTRLCRPFAFVFGKETRELALGEIEKITSQINDLHNHSVCVESKTLDIKYELPIVRAMLKA